MISKGEMKYQRRVIGGALKNWEARMEGEKDRGDQWGHGAMHWVIFFNKKGMHCLKQKAYTK